VNLLINANAKHIPLDKIKMWYNRSVEVAEIFCFHHSAASLVNLWPRQPENRAAALWFVEANMRDNKEILYCEICKNPITNRGAKRFCSKDCLNKHYSQSWQYFSCANCGKRIRKRRCGRKDYELAFCNKKCESEYQKNKQTKRIVGEKYNRLTAVRYIGKNKHNQVVWEFKCDCGSVTIKPIGQVRYGHIKSCGCSRLGGTPGNKLKKGESSLRGLYQHRIVKRSRDLGMTYNITEKDFRALISQPCFYCGELPSREYRSHKSSNGSCLYNGLDRLDVSRGYDTDNVVTCCWACNKAKGTLTKTEFLDHIEKIFNI